MNLKHTTFEAPKPRKVENVTYIDRPLIAPPPPTPFGSYVRPPKLYTTGGPSKALMLQSGGGGALLGGCAGAGAGEGEGWAGGGGTLTVLL